MLLTVAVVGNDDNVVNLLIILTAVIIIRPYTAFTILVKLEFVQSSDKNSTYDPLEVVASVAL